MGCLLPGPNGYRQYIDPLFADLWPTMDQIFGESNEIFPPEYPFHMGGDEVNRNAWMECPSVAQWAQQNNISGNLGDAVTAVRGGVIVCGG